MTQLTTGFLTLRVELIAHVESRAVARAGRSWPTPSLAAGS